MDKLFADLVENKIRHYDRVFDGNGMRQDKEYAYHLMRLLVLELLQEVENLEDELIRSTS